MALEPDYTPKEQASALLTLALSLPFAKEIIGESDARGIRFIFFRFFCIESYTADKQPMLLPWRGMRLVLWKTSLEKKGEKWRRWFGIPIGNTRAVGVVEENFLKEWGTLARRSARKHIRQGTQYQEISLEDFKAYYHQYSNLDAFLRHGFIRIANQHLSLHPENTRIIIAKDSKGSLLGGAIFVHFPDICSSHYLLSFLTEEGKGQATGYALMYWWHQDMQKRDIWWADFGIVWQPGDPLSWKGYSVFKERFHPKKYTYKTYWKWG